MNLSENSSETTSQKKLQQSPKQNNVPMKKQTASRPVSRKAATVESLNRQLQAGKMKTGEYAQNEKIKSSAGKALTTYHPKSMTSKIEEPKIAKMKNKPPVRRLYSMFKKNGLGHFESAFNAYYFYFTYKSDKVQDVLKDEYSTIAIHPTGWEKASVPHLYEENEYDRYLKFLGLLSKIYGFFGNIFAALRRFLNFLLPFITVRKNKRRPFYRFFKTVNNITSVAAPAASIIFTVFFIHNILSYAPSVKLYIDGSEAGIVESTIFYKDVVTEVESQITSVLGMPYKCTVKVDYKIVLAKNPEYINKSELYTQLYNLSQGSITQAYGLYIDGKLIAVMPDEESISTALDEVLDKEITAASEHGTEEEKSETIEYLNEIDIKHQDYPKRNLLSYDELVNILGVAVNKNKVENTVPLAALNILDNIYESAQITNTIARDTVSVAKLDGSDAIDTKADLQFYTPNELLLNSASAELDLKSIKTEIREEVIPFAEVRKDSDKYYEGTEKVTQKGKDGLKEITEKVVYAKDVEISRELLGETTSKEAVDKIILVGTKKKPSTTPSGNYILPLKKFTVGDLFESRSATRFHYGIDFLAPKGTSIYAVDGGTVIFAGTYIQYGNFVKIQHKNGIVSQYGHMSEILVKEGDKVYQGQEIALVGSTGNSTGNHLHFEISKNGTRVNPFGYIPKP